jgi:arylsulfatase A-like enzyme
MKTILLILDALRFDHINFKNTPNLMKLIDQSTFFTNAFTCNTSTIESIPCILCAKKEYDSEKNIAAVLNNYNIHTAMIHSNPIVHAFYSGFKEKIDLKSKKIKMSKGFKKTLRKNLPPSIIKRLKRVRASVQEDDTYLPYARAGETLEFTIRWLRDKENYFLWTHLMDPHIPYYPNISSTGLSKLEIRNLNDKIIESVHGNYFPTSQETKIALQLYREDIKEMDEKLEPFFESLSKDTLLIVTSDHGEEFGEYGQYSHHGNKHVPILSHVPLIFKCPNVKNKIINDYVSTLSITPTILEAQGIKEKIGFAPSLWEKITM